MEEGKGERYLASGRQYGNALLGVRHQEEEKDGHIQHGATYNTTTARSAYATLGALLYTPMNIYNEMLSIILMKLCYTVL